MQHVFRSGILPGERNVIVWLPPGYERSRVRYPVFYLHDGQNIFDPETSFIRGQHWAAGETAEALIAEHAIPPLIIVAVENMGDARIDEYTPTFSKQMNRGGLSDRYARMLIHELMPQIEEQYRVRPGRQFTALGGSSLGGLVTLDIGFRHPHTFGKLAIMSPSLWWDNRYILHWAARAHVSPRPKIWLDVGTNETKSVKASVKDARLLKRILTHHGWRGGRNLHYYEDQGAGHNEGAWAHRFPMVLRYLFGL